MRATTSTIHSHQTTQNQLNDIRRSAPGRKLGRDDNENRRKDYDVDILDEQISDVDEDMSEGGNNSGMENEEHYFDRTKLETRIKENAPPTDFLHNFPRESHQPFKEKKLDFTDETIRDSTSVLRFSKLKEKERSTLKNSKVESKGSAIQIIKYDGKAHFEFNKEAEEILMNYEGNLCFVVLAGKYRTGKSFLLNRLLDLQGEGFKVDPTTEACTEGIWMWPQPLFLEKENLHVFFLDTEGSSSVSRDQRHDAKIFALAILMSSIFIFNSVGCIEETSINQLNLTTTLSANVELNSFKSKLHDSDMALSYFTPKFIWLLRDFTLEIQNSKGQPISSKEYLENALTEDKNKTNEQNKKIKRSLLNYFRDRDCFTMVRPVDEEKDLKKLDSLPRNKIRKEFILELKKLKEKILEKCEPKQLNGINLNSRMFCSMLTNYIESINANGVPNIASAWEYIIENECVGAYNDAIELYIASMKQLLAQDKPKTAEEIIRILKVARDSALEKYQSVARMKDREEIYNEFKDKLKEAIESKETKAIKLNEEMAINQCKKAIHFLTQEIVGNISANIYTEENVEGFLEDFDRVLTQYNETTLPNKKCDILIEFLRGFVGDVLQSISHSIKNKYEAKFSDVGVEKTIFKEKEGNFLDNIQILEKKNVIYEDRIKKVEKEKLEVESQKNTFKSNYDGLQREYEDALNSFQEQKQMMTKKDQTIATLRSELEALKNEKQKKKGGLFACFSSKSKKNKYQ